MPIKGDFEALWKAYPKGFQKDHDADQVAEGERIEKLGKELKKTIGGKVDNDSYVNLCVIRVSYAMNRCGLLVPEASPLKWYAKDKHGNPKVYSVAKGSDGFNYGLGVTETMHFLMEKHGKADFEIKGPFSSEPAGVKIPEIIKGKNGVLLFLVPIWGDASGHVTLWNGKECSDNGYFKEATKVLFWEVVKPVTRPIRIQNLNDSIRIIAKPVPGDSN